MLKNKKLIALIIAFITIFALSYFLYSNNYINILKLQSIFSNNIMIFGIIFFILYGVFISFLPITIVWTVIAGALFGIFYASLICLVSSTITAYIMFLVFRYVKPSEDFFNKYKKLQLITQKLQKNTFKIIFILRLIPIFPFMAVNTISGLLNLPKKQFLLATFLGKTPAIIIYTTIGYSAKETVFTSNFLDNINISPYITIALIIIATITIIPVIYKLLIKRS